MYAPNKRPTDLTQEVLSLVPRDRMVEALADLQSILTLMGTRHTCHQTREQLKAK